MYLIRSNMGLDTRVPTIEQVMAILGEHFYNLASDGPVQWAITPPWGGVAHTGQVRLNGLPDEDGFIADLIAEVTDDLRAGQTRRRTPIGRL